MKHYMTVGCVSTPLISVSFTLIKIECILCFMLLNFYGSKAKVQFFWEIQFQVKCRLNINSNYYSNYLPHPWGRKAKQNRTVQILVSRLRHRSNQPFEWDTDFLSTGGGDLFWSGNMEGWNGHANQSSCPQGSMFDSWLIPSKNHIQKIII